MVNLEVSVSHLNDEAGAVGAGILVAEKILENVLGRPFLKR